MNELFVFNIRMLSLLAYIIFKCIYINNMQIPLIPWNDSSSPRVSVLLTVCCFTEYNNIVNIDIVDMDCNPYQLSCQMIQNLF